MIASDEIARRLELAAACESLVPRWPDLWLGLYERDVQAGHLAAWAAPRWFAERLPAPLLNDIGREFESALFLDRIRKGAGSLYTLQAFQHAQTWRARGYRNLFQPGDFFGEYMHGFAREGVDYALDAPAADLVTNLLREERGYRQEIDSLRANSAVRELATGSLTPPALMVPPGGPPPQPLRNSALPLVADNHFLRARAGVIPRLVGDADGFEAHPDLYSELVPSICGWTLDQRASRKQWEVFSDCRGGARSWALEVQRPSRRDVRFPQLVLRDSDPKSPGVVLPGGEAREIPEFGMSPRGHEVNLRQQWARFQSLMKFFEPALT